MNADEYQKAALRTEPDPAPIFISVGDPQRDRVLSRMMHAMLGMVSEIGELADILKKHLIYGAPLDLVHIVEELGDGDWYRALFADAINVGFEASWERNIAKLRKRFPGKFTQEQALNRDLDAERKALEGKEHERTAQMIRDNEYDGTDYG